jgi:hypothetical protein
MQCGGRMYRYNKNKVLDNQTYMFVIKSATEISVGILKVLLYEKPTGEKDVERISRGV